LPEIFPTFLRFRLHFTATISDITQAFLQLPLDVKNRYLTRFFWYRITQDRGHCRTTDEMTYRFTRLAFGLICSAFLLSAALREHAERHKSTFPTVATLVDSNMFLDDFAAGAGNDNGAITIYRVGQ